MSRSIPIAWGIGAGLAIAVLALWVWPFTIDDAFIPCRYAENLALGRGLAWNPGERAAGVTGIFWTLLLAAARALGVHDLPFVAKAVGLACASAVAGLVVARARGAAGGRWGGAVVALLALVTSLSLAVYAVAGLETAAFTLAVTAAGVLPSRGRWSEAGAFAGLACALRPEGALVLAVVASSAVAAGGPWVGRVARVVALGAVPALVAAAVSWSAFGSVVPDTFFARRAPPGAGVAYLGGALLPTGALLWWPLALAGGARSRRRRTALALVVALVVVVGAVGGDWMPGWRFLVPVWPLTAWLAAHGAVRVRVLLRRRTGRIVAAAAVLGGTLLAAATTAVALPDVRAAGLERARAAPRLVGALRRAHVRHVALVDVGFVGWTGGFRTTDLAGLTDRTIARAPGVYLDKQLDEAYLLARAPDAIVLHVEGEGTLGMFPVERRVAAMPRIAARYHLAGTVPRTPTYRYLLLLVDRR